MIWRVRSAAKTSVLSLLASYDKLVSPSSEPRVAVLNYHDIEAGTHNPFTVEPQDFASQIRDLHRADVTFLDGAGFERLMAGASPAPKVKSVLITFDDGYASFEDHAAPVLREYGASAIIFVHTDRGSIQIGTERPLLDWNAIGRVEAEGFEIGNHSHTHRSCRTLSNDELDEELDRSEEILRTRTGRAPRYFAYPGGVFDERMEARLVRRGYAAAFGGGQGRTSPASNPMKLERICVRRETSTRQLALAMAGALDRYEALRGRR
jgi:peptidoglycan/xylan/chitin deacetylase (PgdA/CDA1 family)